MSPAAIVKRYLEKTKPTWAGKFFYYGLPFRRDIVLQNMKLVFGEGLSHTEVVQLAQCFYSHLASFLKENILLGFLSNEEICQRMSIRGKEHVFEAANRHKGVLLLSGHFGNWEIAPMGAALSLRDFPGRCYCIRKVLSNKYLEKLLFNRFMRAGVQVIPKQKSLRQTLTALANNDAVIFALDQHSRVGKEGILVEFFNKPAGTFRSLAKLAKETGAAVIPVSCYRASAKKHVLEFYPEIQWIPHADPEEEQRLNTQAYNHFIERVILAHPDQWLWMHRRWKGAD